MGSPSAVLTVGLGAWGSVNEVVTLGYGSLTGILKGQWSNVLMLQSEQPTLVLDAMQPTFIANAMQPTIELTGQEWITLGSQQGTFEIELP